ncbi:hemolysin III family protein [Aliikangiella marina]|uniref:Hemolysin III family protein n=1 Tax=Aliikangiella marina TaxID=1712262 RepID=A0A545T711_9GAMM|nr:hemolysin III family protein [Aliikangiella marina]TQV73014.1 hemolysin III family protein [Aliikangiella marina]
MSIKDHIPDYSLHEEIWNVASHAVGFALAIVGLVFLILRAEGPVEVTSVSIYGGTLVFMFLASTVYHAINHPQSKRILKIIDHSAIYLLIAGTYTPFLLISLDGLISLASIIFIWTVAIIGVGFKLFAGHRFPKLSLGTYLSMGWFAVLLGYPLYLAVPTGGLWLLLSGGVLFSLGVIFYVAKHKKYTHAIWHLFVVGGCICHFYSVYLFVV